MVARCTSRQIKQTLTGSQDPTDPRSSWENLTHLFAIDQGDKKLQWHRYSLSTTSQLNLMDHIQSEYLFFSNKHRMSKRRTCNSLQRKSQQTSSNLDRGLVGTSQPSREIRPAACFTNSITGKGPCSPTFYCLCVCSTAAKLSSCSKFKIFTIWNLEKVWWPPVSTIWTILSDHKAATLETHSIRIIFKLYIFGKCTINIPLKNQNQKS